MAGGRAPDAVRFYWGRFLRVVVAYWVALTLITIVLGTDGIFTFSGLWTYYGFTQIYDHTTALYGLPHAWTLCVEITFYALLPVWAWAMRRLPARGEDGRAKVELIALAALFALERALQGLCCCCAWTPPRSRAAPRSCRCRTTPTRSRSAWRWRC